tara:strand:- start:848 stop:1255 length:408 start_codon:yes stop_codon:yes gene_type:complete
MTTKTKQKEMSTTIAFEIIERFMFVLLHRVSKRGYQHFNSAERHQDIQFAAELSNILKGWEHGEEPDPVQSLKAGGIRLPLVSVVGNRKTVPDYDVERDPNTVKGGFVFTNDFPESEIHRLGIALKTIADSHDWE